MPKIKRNTRTMRQLQSASHRELSRMYSLCTCKASNAPSHPSPTKKTYAFATANFPSLPSHKPPQPTPDNPSEIPHVNPSDKFSKLSHWFSALVNKLTPDLSLAQMQLIVMNEFLQFLARQASSQDT
jgi:hypothetical protein